MAVTYRVYELRFGAANTVVRSTASAETYPTLTAAREAAEEQHGPIHWRPNDSTRTTWPTGTPAARPSAYQTTVVVCPAAKGLTEVLAELRRRDAPADLDVLRAEILARQGRGPAPQPPTEEAKPA
ncbi:hypothetical protein [Gordonia rubripertincta]|uniref:hypothetical protein n=1 Tax=Gordonia rubripertincta TaxID=36822 RepID=UPI000B8D3A7E|nr:hypothetical protein [Gordonia rubripertincta]ASR04008.1 hypothetical protein GCWB2_16115 [Gordonia rubripertincta]